MKDEVFPELDNAAWKAAHESAAPNGGLGLTKALHLTTVAIANTRSQIGTNVGRLKDQVETLNTRLDAFNKSSESLSTQALKLTRWIMVATVVSSIATALLAVDVVVKWVSR